MAIADDSISRTCIPTVRRVYPAAENGSIRHFPNGYVPTEYDDIELSAAH
jgi:hypothetical protein